MKVCPKCKCPVIGMFCQTPDCIEQKPKNPPRGYKDFPHWKAGVNMWIMAIIGLGADDLPDYDYYKAWSSNKDPKKVARAAIKAAGGPDL